MEPITLFLLGAAIAPAAFQAIRSLGKIIEELRGQSAVEKQLTQKVPADVRDGISSMLRDPTILKDNPQAILAAQLIIKDVLSEMDQRTQQAIAEGLQQESGNSSVQYVAKLLEPNRPKPKASAASNT